MRFDRKKSLALLCYLAAENRKRPRSELVELLWPKSDERRARTGLRSTLAKIGKVLGEGGEGVRPLATEGDLVGVEPRGVELDLRTLEAAVSLARNEIAGTPPGKNEFRDAAGRRDAISNLEGALGVYRGEFMESFLLDDAPEFSLWLEAERTRWRALFGELCERVSRLQAGEERLEGAIGTARLWAGHAPLEEVPHLRLVELLSAAGDGEGAILAYENFRGTLERDLGIEPSPEMKEVAELLRKEVGERASLGANLARSTATTPLSSLEVPLAGRREEFGALVSEYQACLSGGETRAVAVVGEAGMGKTRLCEEFLGWVRARGADVLKGAASEFGSLPYGPLVEALRPRLERERAPDDLLEDAWLSELSRLLPELKDRYPDLTPAPSGEGEAAKAALFEAVARAVGAIASAAPVVLFLDDLHWADVTTLEVFEYAARRWAERGAPVLMIVAARPEEEAVESLLEGWLPTLGRRLPVRGVSIGPLRGEDVEEILRRLARDGPGLAKAPEDPEDPEAARSELERFGRWLAAESGGQPFYLVETVKALLEEGKLGIRTRPDGERVLKVGPALRLGSAYGVRLPQSVREVIHSRLSRLSPAASELLIAGAVLGRRFGFEALLGVSGLGEAEGLRGLDELLGRHLLLEEGGDPVAESPYAGAFYYSFSHENIRQVAYAEGGQARRLVLHRRAFEVLVAAGAPPAEPARHALAGGLAGEAFAYSVAAGDEAAEVFAVRDAIGHYERARELSEAGRRPGGRFEPSGPEVERLYTQLGRTHEMDDEWEKARAAYEAMLAFARRSGEARLEVVALNHLAGYLFHHEADPRKAAAFLEEALMVAEAAGAREALAETRCNLAMVIIFQPGQSGRSRSLAEGALASARALERPDLVARTLTALARVEVTAGRLEEAAAHAEEGAALSRKLAERSSAARTEHPSMFWLGLVGFSASWRAGNKALEVQCLSYLAQVRTFQGRPQEGVAIAREARSIARELPPERSETMSLWALTIGLQELGEYEETLALARRGIERARALGDAYLLGRHLLRLGDAHVALQNPEEARAAFGEAVGLGHYRAFSPALFCVSAALAEDWDEANVHARRAHENRVFSYALFGAHLHHEVEALVSGGDEDLAREELQRFSERARANERYRVPYLRSLAILGEREGGTKEALDLLREAEVLAERIGLPGELWQIRTGLGELHERREEAQEAREAFSRAALTLKDLAAKIEDEDLKESFLSAPRVRSVLDRV